MTQAQKSHKRKPLKLAIILFLACSTLSSKILFNMGEVTKEDRRFIYPSRKMKYKPIGGFLKDIPQIKVEPRVEFLRSHDEKCSNPIRGYFESHNQVFWYCGDKKIEVSDPTKPGQRTSFLMADAPTSTDFLFILPMSKANDVAIVAKLSSKPGEYEVYLKGKN